MYLIRAAIWYLDLYENQDAFATIELNYCKLNYCFLVEVVCVLIVIYKGFIYYFTLGGGAKNLSYFSVKVSIIQCLPTNS